MSVIKIGTDLGVQKALAATSAASGAAAWWTAAKDVVVELFGVPIQVVLAAATAAFLARSFLPSVGYLQALSAGLAWTAVGTYGAQLGLALIGAWAGVQIPTGAMAGAAMVVAGAGQFVAPVLVEHGIPALRRWLQNLGGPNGNR